MFLTGSSMLEVITSCQSRTLPGSSNHDEFRCADFFPSIKHINRYLYWLLGLLHRECILHHCQYCFKVETCGDMTILPNSEATVLRYRYCIIASTRKLLYSLTRQVCHKKTDSCEGQGYNPIQKAEFCLRCSIRQELGLAATPLPDAAGAALSLFYEIWDSCDKPFIEGKNWKFSDRYTDANPTLLELGSSKHNLIMRFSLDTGFP